MDAICIGCGKKPEELAEYIVAAAAEGITPAEYVEQEEGTYNPANGHFLCDTDYLRAGAPSGPNGWVAP